MGLALSSSLESTMLQSYLFAITMRAVSIKEGTLQKVLAMQVVYG